MDDKVMVFIRPKITPKFNLDPEKIRIAYGDVWIDFRDGQIIARNEEGGRPFSLNAWLEDRKDHFSWPEPTADQRVSGWEINVDFLGCVQDAVRVYGEDASLEQIESVLRAVTLHILAQAAQVKESQKR